MLAKGGFFSESAIRFLNLQKQIPKNYPELLSLENSFKVVTFKIFFP